MEKFNPYRGCLEWRLGAFHGLQPVVNQIQSRWDWELVDKVRNYIKDQESHHAHKTWDEEYHEFIEKYGFQKFIDNNPISSHRP